jgi:hypothetical protein
MPKERKPTMREFRLSSARDNLNLGQVTRLTFPCTAKADQVHWFFYRLLLLLALLVSPILGCGGRYVNSDASLNQSTGILGFSPAPGTYGTPQTVSLSDSNPAAVIYYTTGGTASSPRTYSAPIPVSATTTIEAYAVINGTTGPMSSATYTISTATPAGNAPPAPILAPAGGNYTTAQSVSLSDSDTSATIYYTIDGSEPTTSSSVYSAPVNIQTSTTIRALAVDSGLDSTVASATYTISGATLSPAPPAPVFSPGADTYSTAQSVSLTDSDTSATIYYTIDGSEPSNSSSVYTSPLNIQTSTTIRALAVDGGLDSPVVSANYTISASTPSGTAPPAPVFSPGEGAYTTAQSVVLEDAAQGAAIFYTLDGSTPSSSSNLYTGPISVLNSVTIQAVAVLAGLTSTVASSTYVVNGPPPPSFSPAPGNYSAPLSVSLSDTDANSLMYYTVDGSTPSASSTQYMAPISVSSSTSIRAIAVDKTLTSQIAVGGYNFPSIGVNPTSLSFENVPLNTSASESITVTASGGAPLTVSQVTVSGTGYSFSGPTLPATLNSGQSLAFQISYLPTTTGTSTGQVVILSNALNQSTVDVPLSGQGQAGGAVNVSPPSATVPVNGIQQFSATVTGLTNSVVGWSVTGAGCGGTSCGSISSTGLYTAPPLAPTPNSVTVTATSNQNSSISGSATVNLEASGAVYYLAPAILGGNDANSGTSSASPWLTPNHSLNCGDEIVAVPGSYDSQNFYTGTWGTVHCTAGNSVAWLTCQEFDACKIYATANEGMWVDQSYWGVQGWEISTAPSDVYGACFFAAPNWNNPVEIHHIVFANDVANSCSQSGFSSVNHGSVGVDYFVVIGSIAYNSALGSETCTSGISIYQPVQSDSTAGTHLYVAGNFSYANLEPSQCNGTSPTDGEGIIFDTFDGSQGNLPTPYAAQAVAENNVVFGNGGRGIEVLNNAAGTSHSPIYIEQNTSWGNLTDPNQNWLGCGEIAINEAYETQVTGNLIATRSADGCGSNPIYALSVSGGSTSDQVTGNFAFGYNGYNTFVYNSGAFSFGSNTLGTNPQFENASVSSAPSCSGASNVPDCMTSTVANFTPTVSAAQSYGYQIPTATPASNALFPQWLCNVNLPQGLITLACQQ